MATRLGFPDGSRAGHVRVEYTGSVVDGGQDTLWLWWSTLWSNRLGRADGMAGDDYLVELWPPGLAFLMAAEQVMLG